MSKVYISPRTRQITASVAVDISSDFGAPVYFLQNNTGTDANVTFNGGSVSLVLKAGSYIEFNTPIWGEVLSDQNLIALA